MTNDTIPPAVKVALLVILNHVEPGWENCVAFLRQWLAETPTQKQQGE